MQPIAVDSANLFRLVHFFDILAAIVFAVSGALVASRKGLDVMAFMWFAVITGVGGGTVRDLILNVPVFWVQNPVHVSACLVTAVVMHFVAPLVESRYQDAPSGSMPSDWRWSPSPARSRPRTWERPHWSPSQWGP